MHLDAERLEALYLQLGATGAEDVLCRALEEVAARLARAERCWRAGRPADMRKAARGLIAIAEQVGMSLLARVALDVMACIDACEETALDATFCRLLRIGERSLNEAGELQDLTI